MPKRMSIAQLGRGGLARAIQAAQREPVLISELSHPVAWVVSAEALARVASRRGAGDAYQSLLELLGIALNDGETTKLAPRIDAPSARRVAFSTFETGEDP